MDIYNSIYKITNNFVHRDFAYELKLYFPFDEQKTPPRNREFNTSKEL